MCLSRPCQDTDNWNRSEINVQGFVCYWNNDGQTAMGGLCAMRMIANVYMHHSECDEAVHEGAMELPGVTMGAKNLYIV